MPPYIPSKKRLDEYFNDLMRIEEHRSVATETRINRLYKDMLKDLNSFLGVEYANLAEDDVLTYGILTQKGQYARFMEQVVEKVNNISPKVSQEITSVVNDTYKIAYEGMVKAVSKSVNNEDLGKRLKSIKTVPATVIKAAVNNPIAGLTLTDTLEKNRKEIVYNIKQTVGVGLMNGDRMSTMAKRISDQVDKDYRKSMLIARTEVHRVRETGHNDSCGEIDDILKDADSDYRMVKVWKTMQDGSVRNTFKANHVKMNGQTVLQDEKFDLGGGYETECPGKSGLAQHDCNCRCYVSHTLMNDAEFYAATGRHFPETDNKEKKLEKQEQQLLDEQTALKDEKEKLEQRQKNLESYEYDGIWKEPVTPKDYEAKASKIQAKRDYYNDQLTQLKNREGKYANTNFYNDSDIDDIIKRHQKCLNMLDDFEVQGKTYMKLSKRLTEIDGEQLSINASLKSVRADLMKVKGIDPKKLQAEIDDIAEKIKKMSTTTFDKKVLEQIKFEFEDGWVYHTDPTSKDYLDDKLKFLQKKQSAGVITPKQQATLDELEEFFDKYNKAITPNADPKKLTKLQKQLKDKQDELDKIRKRYGLEDDKFSQTRKDNAHWFKDKKKADGVIRGKAGEVWQAASDDEKRWIYEYTQSYHKYNEPLRGIEYGTTKFLGVGNVDLDQIGVKQYGFKPGEIKKQMDCIESIIDKSSYDFDMWLQRGLNGSKGISSFLGIDEAIWTGATEKELQDVLVGKTITEHAFCSTSAAKGNGFSGSLICNIYAPKGTKMMYVEPFSRFGNGDGLSWDGKSGQSSFGSEFEMILQRGTRFKITKVERKGGQTYIDLEIIEQKV